jgi:hypothetical protein
MVKDTAIMVMQGCHCSLYLHSLLKSEPYKEKTGMYMDTKAGKTDAKTNIYLAKTVI